MGRGTGHTAWASASVPRPHDAGEHHGRGASELGVAHPPSHPPHFCYQTHPLLQEVHQRRSKHEKHLVPTHTELQSRKRRKQGPLISKETLLTPQIHSFPFSFLTKTTSCLWGQLRGSGSPPELSCPDQSWTPGWDPDGHVGPRETALPAKRGREGSGQPRTWLRLLPPPSQLRPMSQAQNLREPGGRGRSSKRQRVRHPGVPFPFCLLSPPHGGSTHKASLSHGGKHLKCPEKNLPLSGELGHWPLCPKGLGGGGSCFFFFFPLAICPENHPVLCNFGRRGLDLRLSRTRTFQPKNWGSGATGDPCRERAQRSTDSGGLTCSCVGSGHARGGTVSL